MREPSIVADVVDQVAELSKGERGHWSPLTKELARTSAKLRRTGGVTPRGTTQAQVVLGSAHAEFVRVARDESKRRIVVASHRWGTPAKVTLAPALTAAKRNGIDIDVYYGTVSRPVDVDAPGKLSDESGKVSIRVKREPRLHAKLLAWDESSVVVTSQNWLSSDPPDSAPRQEIGVFLNRHGLAKAIVERLQAALQNDSKDQLAVSRGEES